MLHVCMSGPPHTTATSFSPPYSSPHKKKCASVTTNVWTSLGTSPHSRMQMRPGHGPPSQRLRPGCVQLLRQPHATASNWRRSQQQQQQHEVAFHHPGCNRFSSCGSGWPIIRTIRGGWGGGWGEVLWPAAGSSEGVPRSGKLQLFRLVSARLRCRRARASGSPPI